MTVDWHELFGLSVPPLEMLLRGTAMYLFLFVLFRAVIRRRIGAIGMADLLVLVLIADAAQNAMAGEYRSVSDGCILVSTIIGWDVLIDWLKLRQHGIDDLAEVARAYMESDGEMSVIRRRARATSRA